MHSFLFRFRISPLVLLLCSSLLAVGCEEIVDDPGALPYEEKLVIRSIIAADEPMDSIDITRTLPPLENYEDEKAWVHGALVIVRHSGIADTLLDVGRGQYFKPGIIARPGERFELDVVWNNKRATATTRIPQHPTIASTKLTYTYGKWGNRIDVIDAMVKPRTGEVYSATYRYRQQGSPYTATDPYVRDMYRVADTTANGLLKVSCESYLYYPGDGELAYQIVVQSYDEPYYSFFSSYHSGGGDDDPVFSNTRNIKWNVQGDAIGVFIGIATAPPVDVK